MSHFYGTQWFGQSSFFEGGSSTPSLTGTWAASATPVNASRTGFDTDTVLPEFGSNAAPERTEPIETSLELIEASGVVIGSYTDEQGITGSVSGTYDSGTGAVNLTGSCGDWDITVATTFGVGALTGSITIARNAGGASSETRTWTAAKGAAVSPSTAYYVDSLAGNDVNSGTSAAAPKATIASAISAGFGTGGTIRLARGSRWRESIQNLGTGTTVEAYGAGPRPVIDTFDPILAASWSKTAGLTNVYDTAFTAEDLPSVSEGYIVKDGTGKPLSWVADTTTCDATVGSYTGPIPTGGADTIYIHPRSSADPTAQADGYYEITSRNHAVELSGSVDIISIMGRGALHDNGVIVVRAISDTEDNPLVSDCWAIDGGKHHFYHCGTTDVSRGVRNCVAIGGMPCDTTADAFVCYRNTVTSAIMPVFIDCALVAWPDSDVITVGGAAGRLGSGPLIMHLGATPGGFFGDAVVSDFGTAYDTGNFSLPENHAKILSGIISERKRGGGQHITCSNGSLTISNSRFYNHAGVVPGDNNDRRALRVLVPCDVTITDSIFVWSIAVSGGGVILPYGTLDMNGVIIAEENAAGTIRGMNTTDGPASLTQTGCVYTGAMLDRWLLDIAGSSTTSSDYNVVDGGRVRENPAATTRLFTTYQGDQVLYDQNSVTTTPTWNAEADASRPVYIETAGSLASRGFAAGPARSAPDGDGWTLPSTYSSALEFIDSL